MIIQLMRDSPTCAYIGQSVSGILSSRNWVMCGLGVHTDTNILTEYQIEGIIDILKAHLS